MGNVIHISVILAVYNGELYLKEAIDSILSQTFKNFEFIIVNDGSTDSTSAIISGYDDPRIVCIDNELNRGLTYSLNTGLSKSKGKYIARMDADDVSFPQRLQVQFDFMEAHSEVGICGSYIEEMFFEKPNSKKIQKFPESDIEIKSFTFFQAPFCHPTVMIRRSVLEENNLQYPDAYYRAEDYALWVKLLKYTKGYNIPSALLQYRKHEASETALADKNENEKNKILNEVQNLYFTQNGLSLNSEELLAFSLFANRSIGYNLSFKKQHEITKVLKNFFSQLSDNQISLLIPALDYFSTACFYRFFVSRKFPLTGYLWKLCFKGFFIYLKRFFHHWC
jgi:glycosyltransferase involved in cell wall biosynthesis